MTVDMEQKENGSTTQVQQKKAEEGQEEERDGDIFQQGQLSPWM